MSQLYTSQTPAEVKDAKGLHLITQSTPNGQKVQILLEELKLKYGIDWTTSVIDIDTNVQKEDWFLRLNPNGRIPVLVDNTVEPVFTVHETSAQLVYLVNKYDKNDEFWFSNELEQSEALQWLFFWHGSGAPYQGQTNHFNKKAPKGNDYSLARYRNETLRVYGVLEIRLSGKYTGAPREYLAGPGKGKYSIADVGTWPWVKNYANSGFTEEEIGQFPHLKEYIKRLWEREAVKVGTSPKYKIGGEFALKL